jgi:PAS domain S-box-containing protein
MPCADRWSAFGPGAAMLKSDQTVINLNKCCQAAAIASLLLGFVVLCGWAFHIDGLKSVFPGFATMKVNTALCILLSGASLWMLLPSQCGILRKHAGRLLALLVAGIAGITLCEYLSGLNLGIDQLLAADTISYATVALGRMAPTTAVALFSIGSALVCLNWQTRRGYRPAQVISLISALIAMLAIIGYLFHATALYKILMYTHVAVHTAIGLLLLSLGIFLARPESGIARELTDAGSGGVMARRFLPAVFFIPVALGWIRMQGQLAGWYSTEMGLALATTANIVFFFVLVCLNARKMNEEHRQRGRTELAVSELNAALELQVQERTESSRHNLDRFLTACRITTDAFYIFDSVRDGMGEIIEFRFSFVNDVGACLLSSTPEDLQGLAMREKAPKDLSHELFGLCKRVVDAGKPLEQEFTMNPGGSRTIWLYFRVIKLDDGVVAIATDTSVRKQADIKLIETSNRFRLLVEGVKDHAFFTLDLNGIVDSWNLGAEQLLGYTEAQIVGQNFCCLFTPEDIARGLPQKQLHIAAEGGREHDEGWRVRANGEKFWAEVTKTALTDDTGKIRGFAKLIQDVTERKNAAVALEEATREAARLKLVATENAAQERLRLQEQFLSHVSHELRTPLTAIYFYLINLLDGLVGDLNPQQHEDLSSALSNVEQLKAMVSDLLDLTRTDNHKLLIVPEQIDSATLIAEVLGTCRPHADAKNIGLSSFVAWGLPFLWADACRLKQILINLVDNGIKFTPEGGSLILRCRSWRENDSFLCLSVTDTGSGISSENQQLIFDRMAQLGNGDEASRRGLGLGLFIARQLVIAQGGRIWVKSELGAGATFLFILPVYSLARKCAGAFNAANPDAGNVALIVVDVSPLDEAHPCDPLETRNAIELCIRNGHDVLFASSDNLEWPSSSFVITCSQENALAEVERRIFDKLETLDGHSRCKTEISSKMLLRPAGQSQEIWALNFTAQIEQLVRDHSPGGKAIDVLQKVSDHR